MSPVTYLNFHFLSARPATNMVAAGRGAPRCFWKTGRHGSWCFRSVNMQCPLRGYSPHPPPPKNNRFSIQTPSRLRLVFGARRCSLHCHASPLIPPRHTRPRPVFQSRTRPRPLIQFGRRRPVRLCCRRGVRRGCCRWRRLVHRQGRRAAPPEPLHTSNFPESSCAIHRSTASSDQVLPMRAIAVKSVCYPDRILEL